MWICSYHECRLFGEEMVNATCPACGMATIRAPRPAGAMAQERIDRVNDPSRMFWPGLPGAALTPEEEREVIRRQDLGAVMPVSDPIALSDLPETVDALRRVGR